LLGGIDSEAVGRAVRLLDRAAVEIPELIVVWRETGLAAVGAALLARTPVWDPCHWHAVPKRVDQPELQKLIAHLSSTERGLELDRFAEWKGLPTAYREALRLGLREHKGAIDRLLSQLRLGGSSAERPPPHKQVLAIEDAGVDDEWAQSGPP
jgi:hypothetical protein